MERAAVHRRPPGSDPAVGSGTLRDRWQLAGGCHRQGNRDFPQTAVPADVRTPTRAVSRVATKQWQDQWPDSFFPPYLRESVAAPCRRRGSRVRGLGAPAESGPLGALSAIPAPYRPPPLCGVRAVHQQEVLSGALCRVQGGSGRAGARAAPLSMPRWHPPAPTGNVHMELSQLRDADLVAALVTGYYRHWILPPLTTTCGHSLSSIALKASMHP